MTAISRSRGRRAVRTTLAAGAVSLGLAALTACDKPSPNAHFTLGTATSTSETATDCYGHGEALGVDEARACLEDTSDVRVFTTEGGETLRVGVDPKIAENGWLLFVNGNPHAIDPSYTTYRSFPADQLYAASDAATLPGQNEEAFADVVQITVAQVSEDYDTEALMAAFGAAQTGDFGPFDDALFGQFEGVWNLQLEQKEH
ncbi:hypothetical protein [Streptomyces bohaiensis]|uniref:DUF2771 domain-containing protein n=1 Tax=Streptomyces bohaiensis TaxID=1431344 RepID=A0ABX1CC51_9ACTN|nr:hypothetical protein [Streptomyces bohaiensis]NJQ15708.1 hypothetical protein [Streptomyces bohaiensis]